MRKFVWYPFLIHFRFLITIWSYKYTRNFSHIVAWSTVIDDVTSKGTHRIFNTNWYNSGASFTSKFDHFSKRFNYNSEVANILLRHPTLYVYNYVIRCSFESLQSEGLPRSRNQTRRSQISLNNCDVVHFQCIQYIESELMVPVTHSITPLLLMIFAAVKKFRSHGDFYIFFKYCVYNKLCLHKSLHNQLRLCCSLRM